MLRTKINRGIFILLIALVLIVPTIQSISMNDEIELEKIVNYQSISSFGWNRYGIVLINFTNAEGIPNEDYKGILTDMNATFNGTTQLIITHLLFPLKSALVFETCNDLNVKIDFLYTYILYHENASVMLAYSWKISWSEV
jgi:hypothetical protein